MSKSTSILANHRLDTSSLENLAKEVSLKLKATIEYGYEQFFDYEKEKTAAEIDFNYVICGTIAFEGADTTYTLIDKLQQFRLFVEKYGLEELDNPYFLENEYRKKEIIDSQDAIEYELEENNEVQITIYRDTMDMWLVDSVDWHSFQRCFLYKQNENDLKHLNDWRIENRDWIYKFGGDFMFVGCYEDESSVLFEEAAFKTSQEIKALVAEQFSDNLVNIPNYLNAKLYVNKPEYVQERLDSTFIKKMNYAIQNNISFTKIKIAYPCMFYDDFHDLESSKIIASQFDVFYDGSLTLESEKENEAYIATLFKNN